MRVLLIAPRMDDIPAVDDEVSAVVSSGLRVKLLSGRVTRRQIAGAITSGEYDLLWLATHGAQEGVYLSDGLWETNSMVSYVVANGIRHVFLNTCDSFAAANAIAQEAGVDVVATVGQAGDRTAYETGTFLASHLADGKEFRQAYELSKPGRNDTYLYLSGGLGRAPRRREAGVDTHSAMLAHVERELRRVTSLIDGDPDYGIVGIRKDLAQVLQMTQAAREERDALRTELRAVVQQLTEERRERGELRLMLEEERRERKEMKKQMDELATALQLMGASIPRRRSLLREWAGPGLSLLTILMLFYMMGVLFP